VNGGEVTAPAGEPSRRVRRWMVALVAVLVVVVGMPVAPVAAAGDEPGGDQPPADGANPDGANPDGDAPDEPPPPPIEVARPFIRDAVRRLDAAAAELVAVGARQQAVATKLAEVQGDMVALADGDVAATRSRVQRLEAGIVDADRRSRTAEARAAALMAQAQRVAVGLYLTGPMVQVNYAATLGSTDALERTRAIEMVRSGVAGAREQLLVQRDEAERLGRAVDRRRQALERERQALADAEQRYAALAAEATRLSGRAAALAGQATTLRVDAAVAQDQVVALLEGAGSPGRRAADPTLTIMGPSVLSAEQLTGWFMVHNSGGGDRQRIAELTRLFIEEGAAVGVRGDVAFVQAVLETGGFRFTGSHNYAGIGHCDSCPRGYAFGSAREGVRGQVQLLRAYADATVTPADLPGGPVSQLDVSKLGVKGCCVTWWGLTGVWATALHYGGSILGLYEAALLHAAAATPAN
jgi:hypothetical protein